MCKPKKAEKRKKYEVNVIYVKASGNLGCKKLEVGKYHSDDFRSCTEEASVTNQMRRLYDKLLIDSDKFDYQLFKDCGGIFNKKFWEVNLDWIQESDINRTAEIIVNRLKTYY